MTKTALVFIHGVNEHLPEREEMARWRKALGKGGINPELLGLHTTFGYYADWFFKGSNTPKLSEFNRETLNEAALKIESELSSVANEQSRQSNEALFGFDASTLIPQRVIRVFLERMFKQLFQYFDNAEINHPANSQKSGLAREVIRVEVLNSIIAARELAGTDGNVLILAHSMGSVVAWDLLAHVPECPEVQGLITFGSPLALDFVKHGLSSANGEAYNRKYPKRLQGDWHNLTAHFDLAGQFDTDFKREFGKGADDFKIHHRRLSNPETISNQGLWTLVESSHRLTGYLRHAEMAAALHELSNSDIQTPSIRPVQDSITRWGGRRTSRIRETAFNRFQESAARRREIAAGQGRAMGRALFESDSRLLKKLSLMDVPMEVAKALVDKVDDGDESSFINLERILGSRDFLPSSFALKAAALTSAVGKLVVTEPGIGSWSGTGFMISQHLMMTNNHVISSPDEAAKAVFYLDYNLTSEEEERRAVRVLLRPDIFFITSSAHKLDYTIVAVEIPPEGLRRPWFQLIAGSGKALIGDHVNIIQHPDGRRQEMVIRNSQVIFVEEDKDYVYYQADTEGGSSGAPVCSDQWQLAFLHHASVPKNDPRASSLNRQRRQVGTQDVNANGDWVSNEGIRISRIVADARTKLLSSRHHALFDACFDDVDLTQYVHIAPRTFGNQTVPLAGGEGINNNTSSTDAVNYPMARQSDNGGMSWLFELNFGPAGLSGPSNVPVGMLPHGRISGPQSPQRTNQNNTDGPASRSTGGPTSYVPKGPTDASIRDAAHSLIESAQIETEYYDAEKDAASIEAYYHGTTENSPVALFNELRDLLRLSHTKEFSYTRARHKVLYPYADLHEDRTLKSVYSGEEMKPADIITNELSLILRASNLPLMGQEMLFEGSWLDMILDAADGLEVFENQPPFNCEHVVPQSWFNKRQPMKADLHHLFTCESRCNSFRNNFSYGEFDNYDAGHLDPNEASLRQLCGYRDIMGGETRFEPQLNKGAVARATLYFMIRYPGEIGDADNEYGSDSLDMLLEWHDKEPPSPWEKHRNRAIFLNQGNRNPLIDKPELGRKIGFHKGLG
ncbi:MAG: endonuclease [Pseudomonadota bacterium]